MQGCIWGERKNMRQCYKKEYRAYFTVEAAMVMPAVFACYLLTVLLMIYIYERCVWEQNTCRLSVWKKYVEGLANMSPEAEEIPEKDIYRYLLQCLEEEESGKFFLGQDIATQMKGQGEFVQVNRERLYPQFNNQSYNVAVSCISLDPVEYIRMTNMLKKQIKESGDVSE